MVHKKSEYTLQYHKLSKDVRSQIWKDNVEFREQRRLHNQSDHYWNDQLTEDNCACEEQTDSSVDDAGHSPAVPTLRGKHKSLADEYNSRHFVSSREMAVQTPDWSIFNSQFDASSQDGTQNISTGTVTIPDRGSSSNVHEAAAKSLLYRPSNPSPPKTESAAVAKCVSVPSPALPAKQHIQPTMAATHSKKQHKDKEVKKSVTVHSSLNPSPTRTGLRLYHEGPKTHFASYGWNDSDKDIGEKKTYNVCAPPEEVYLTALHSMEQRQKEIENYLALQKERRQQLRPLHSVGPVNLSSIWMTEYQDKFCKGIRVSFHPLARSYCML